MKIILQYGIGSGVVEDKKAVSRMGSGMTSIRYFDVDKSIASSRGRIMVHSKRRFGKEKRWKHTRDICSAFYRKHGAIHGNKVRGGREWAKSCSRA
jgi:hypothetical protein